MIKVTGLDKLTRELKQAQKALAELDGKFGEVSFDPYDPASIEAAMQHSDRMIDERVGSYSSNGIIGPMAKQMKERFRQAILDRAAALRLKSNEA